MYPLGQSRICKWGSKRLDPYKISLVDRCNMCIDIMRGVHEPARHFAGYGYRLCEVRCLYWYSSSNPDLFTPSIHSRGTFDMTTFGRNSAVWTVVLTFLWSLPVCVQGGVVIEEFLSNLNKLDSSGVWFYFERRNICMRWLCNVIFPNNCCLGTWFILMVKRWD